MKVTIGCLSKSGQNVHEGQKDRESVYLRKSIWGIKVYKIYEVQDSVYGSQDECLESQG